jgi:hypothetical protein
MDALPWVAIFLSASTSLIRTPRRWTLSLAALGYGIAFALGQLRIEAVIAIALLVGTGIVLTRKTSAILKYLCHTIFLLIALGLFEHLLPGFHNLQVIHAERFTQDAAPYTMYLNFDKTLIGFWLLLVFPWIRLEKKFSLMIVTVVVACAVTSAVCLLITLQTGFVAWEPKWPPRRYRPASEGAAAGAVDCSFRGSRALWDSALAGRCSNDRVGCHRWSGLRFGLPSRRTTCCNAHPLRAQPDSISLVHLSHDCTSIIGNA